MRFCHIDASVGMWMIAAPVPEAISPQHRDEGDVREARHDDAKARASGSCG